MRLKRECEMSIKKHLYTDEFVIKLSNNKPTFKDEDEKQLEGCDDPFSDLDQLGRCGPAFALINQVTCAQNQADRPNIKCMPTGFPTKENFINNHYIFQRCHLIGYQLYAKRSNKYDNENANKKNLFAGTRFMNNVMLYYENKVKKCVDNESENGRVLYRVSPYFEGSNALAYGVQMEAKFINNEGEKNLFNVFVYNKQPDIVFDYRTGEIDQETSKNLIEKRSYSVNSYITNEKKRKFHIKDCPSVYNKGENKYFEKSRDDLILQMNYSPCGICDSGLKPKAIFK